MTLDPTRPAPADDIRAALDSLRAQDLPTHGGRTLSYVYDSGLAEADAIGREALAAFAATNGLDPTAFPSLARLESELVALATGLLRGPPSTVGVATSGGTESLVLAVLAARNGSPHVERPQVVAPSTVHAAVHKAGHLLGVDVVSVPVDPTTFRADPMAMAAAVTDDTVLLVASAPSYAHGVVDPVEEVAAIAREHGIRCHVDACIGGWVLPFLDDAPPWTFAVEGVTSISVDLHKYAYTPKGVSLLLHRDPALRRGHVYASAAWPGYTMLHTTLQSTKSGGPLAAAWAVVHAIGLERYRELAGVARRATLDVAAAVEAIDGLQVVVAPDSTLLALEATSGCDVFTVADEMASRGWLVQPQMAFAGHPATVHLTLCAATAAHTDELVAALTESVAAARESGPVVVDPDLVAAAGQIDPAGLDEATLDGLLAIAGLGGGDGPLQVPDRMAEVNALLDAVPAALREALLAAVLDRLTR
ncbi:aminotransferase class V-fold PLP-dependent enzyme [Janibacter hoylei]|uniref:pyridoxal phosphate-dependent decarboxylase family protein n=1 Tax=Janibacter hoylei TaxID=364298 RepID=UPI002237A214|nr:aminotransferase class V-fold PLP-dependent enzyme [Janibacter hoylei]MCW4601376.1 aminotransferase class V-fold PLP-dependent enzyme [Janibacter hoylei]